MQQSSGKKKDDPPKAPKLLTTEPILHTIAVHSIVSSLLNVDLGLAVSGVTTPVIDFGQKPTPTNSEIALEVVIDGDVYSEQKWREQLAQELNQSQKNYEAIGKLIHTRNRVRQALTDHQAARMDESKFENWYSFVQEQLNQMDTGKSKSIVLQQDGKNQNGSSQKPRILGMQGIQNKIVLLQDWYHCLFEHDRKHVTLSNLPLYKFQWDLKSDQLSTQKLYSTFVSGARATFTPTQSENGKFFETVSKVWKKVEALFIPVDTNDHRSDSNGFEQWGVVDGNDQVQYEKLLKILEFIRQGNGDVKQYTTVDPKEVGKETKKNLYSNMVTIDYFKDDKSTKEVGSDDVKSAAQSGEQGNSSAQTKSWFGKLLETAIDFSTLMNPVLAESNDAPLGS